MQRVAEGCLKPLYTLDMAIYLPKMESLELHGTAILESFSEALFEWSDPAYNAWASGLSG
jgi:hypothetical protein